MADQQYGRPKHGDLFHPGCYPLPRSIHQPPAKAAPPRQDPALLEPPATPCARDYEGLRALLNDKRIELCISMLELDHVADLPNGYSAKLLCGGHGKNMGPGSLTKLLAALGVAIQLVPDTPRIDDSPSEINFHPQVALLRERGRRGHALWMAKTNPRKRIEWARKAARVRWGRRRRSSTGTSIAKGGSST